MAEPLTYGLTHVALAVSDIQRSINFYREIFDIEVMYVQEEFAQVNTPGSHDIIVFEKKHSDVLGTTGGITHIGFRLKRKEDLEAMIKKIQRAGAAITSQGEFIPGEPYVFFKDPDGYEIEVWYEILPEK